MSRDIAAIKNVISRTVTPELELAIVKGVTETEVLIQRRGSQKVERIMATNIDVRSGDRVMISRTMSGTRDPRWTLVGVAERLTTGPIGTESGGGGSGSSGMVVHDLSGAYHTGTLSDSQAPQFLKTDGSRNLTGNLTVDAGITIDSVDLSAFKSSFDTHIGGTAKAQHSGGLGDHSHESAGAEGGQLDHGAALTNVTADQHHIAFIGLEDNAGTAILPATDDRIQIIDDGVVNADASGNTLALSIAQGQIDHGSIAGLSDDDHPQYTALAQNETITGAWTFQAGLTTRTILPETTDTYDLGSSTKLWRHGYLSELDALIFAEQTLSLVGGWLVVGHDQGTLPYDVDNEQTTIDFGEAMTPNDFLLFRAALKTEYMQVGTLVSGTTYNVSRDVADGGRDPQEWPAGTPYLVLGYNGDGRIEIEAYNSPRISMFTQGTAYNSQTEMLRIGDLYGNWGYSLMSGVWGVAIGEYAGDKVNLISAASEGLLVRLGGTTKFAVAPTTGYVTVGDSTGENVYITSGGVYIRNGSTERVSMAANGLAIKDKDGDSVISLPSTGGAEIIGTLDVSSPGEITAGGGNVVLDSGGITVQALGSSDIKFYFAKDSENLCNLYAYYGSGRSELCINAWGTSNYPGARIEMWAAGYGIDDALIRMTAGSPATISLQGDVSMGKLYVTNSFTVNRGGPVWTAYVPVSNYFTNLSSDFGLDGSWDYIFNLSSTTLGSPPTGRVLVNVAIQFQVTNASPSADYIGLRLLVGGSEKCRVYRHYTYQWEWDVVPLTWVGTYTSGQSIQVQGYDHSGTTNTVNATIRSHISVLNLA